MILVGFLSCGLIEIGKHYAESAFKRVCSFLPVSTIEQNPIDAVQQTPTPSTSIEMIVPGQDEEAALDGKDKDAAVEKGTKQAVCETDGNNDTAMKKTETDDDSTATAISQYGIISTIFVGDFFHNFADGIFIGAAFQTCSAKIAWTIVFSTVFHEFAQEIADFIVLTKKGKLSIINALVVNGVSGLSVLIGGIVIGFQDMHDDTVGMLLAFGAGNYIYLAAAELYPAFHDFTKHSHKLMGLLVFAIGATAIGLVLLDHEHCEADNAHDSH
jgi:zinc transporter ZupT